ncbi:mannose-6-phosphate isomerase [Spirochaetia bacterium]|nr:mannose-6-phosphate isomerase [Spirochaetia bacterium]
MTGVYKLQNTVKHYAWGSPEWIPALLGTDNPEAEPWAELWMGIHSEGPSLAITGTDGRDPGKTVKTIPLSEVATIPFLLKFLAAGSPLSIQAHPNMEQAREGFERENKANIARNAPERNYKDPSHKPEILCALTPFTAMAGFRESAETKRLLSLVTGTEKLRTALGDGYQPFLSTLFGLTEAERKALNRAVLAAAAAAAAGATAGAAAAAGASAKNPDTAVLTLCGEFAAAYPNDPGIISPLYLNVIELRPFQAIFVPAGILHAYVHGFAMECMANSDNVLRGGLTPKHIDLPELFSILRFEPFKPELLQAAEVSPNCYCYKTSCGEFSLYRCGGTAESSSKTELAVPGEAIIALYEGSAAVCITDNGGQTKNTVRLYQGESAFVGRREPGETLVFLPAGNCTLFAALKPE